MVLAHVLRDLEQRMTEALKNMMNVCLFQRKQVPLQISKRRRSQNLFYVYICKSTKQEGRGGEHSPPLILYMEKEKAKEDVLGGKDFLFMMASILLVSLIRRNNQGII